MPHYRSDIDGLRAVSVILVVLFHYGSRAIPGGFIGVDVFFVISGFLITDILQREISQGTFSLLSFYDRRIRRIFPALLAVILTTLGFGAILLFPGDYEAAAKSALYAALSAANVFFLKNTGYFNVLSEMMPLLHTWSLAVEEQFYLVWPLVLWLLTRLFQGDRRRLVAACAVLTFASFAWSLSIVGKDLKGAFYLPHSRAWELGLGALIALAPPALWRRWTFAGSIGGLAGLGLILYAAATFTKDTEFPGAHALLPAVGAAFLVAPWAGNGPIQRMLSLKPLVFFGRISYSLYLWHWPVLVFWRHYIGGGYPSPQEATALCILSVILAAASWRWIEQPFRQHNRGFRPVVVGAGLAAACLCALVSWHVVREQGYPDRLSPQAQAYVSLDRMWDFTCPGMVPEGPMKDRCTVGANWKDAKTRAVVWGDSHAEHLLPLLHSAGLKTGTSIALLRACAPIVLPGGLLQRWAGIPNYAELCAGWNAQAVSMLRTSPDVELVLLAWFQHWHTFYFPDRPKENGPKLMANGVDYLMTQIDGPGRRVVILGDIPYFPHNPVPCFLAKQGLPRRPCAVGSEAISRASFDAAQGAVLKSIQMAAARHPNVTAHMLTDYLCDKERCLTDLNGEFLYRDAGHIRRNLKLETAEALSDLMRLPDLLAAKGPLASAVD